MFKWGFVSISVLCFNFCPLKKAKNETTKQKLADKYSTLAWCSEYLFRTYLITRVFKSTSSTSQKNTITTSK